MRFCLKYLPISLLLASSSHIILGESAPSAEPTESLSSTDVDTTPVMEDTAQTSSPEIPDGDEVSPLNDSMPPADMIPPSELKETAVLSSDMETPPADMTPSSQLEETTSSSSDLETPPAYMIPPSKLKEAESAPNEESISPVSEEDSEALSSDSDPAQTEMASVSGTKANPVPPVMAVAPQAQAPMTPAPPTPAVQNEPQNTIISSMASVAGSLINQKAARDNYAYQLARQQAEQKAMQQNYEAQRAAEQMRLGQQAQMAQQEQYFRQNQMAQNAQLAMQGQLAQQSFLMQQQARVNNPYPPPMPYPAQAPYNQRYLAEEAVANANFQAELALQERNRQKPIYGTQSYYSHEGISQVQGPSIPQKQDFQSMANEPEVKKASAKDNGVDYKSNIFVQADEAQKKETSPEEASEEDIEKQIAEAKIKLEALKAKNSLPVTASDVKDKSSGDGKANPEELSKTKKQDEKKLESTIESKKPAMKEKPSDTSSSENKSSLSIMNFSDKSVQKPSKKMTTLGKRELLKEKETLHFDEHGNPHVEDSENSGVTSDKENAQPSSAKMQVNRDEKKVAPLEKKP